MPDTTEEIFEDSLLSLFQHRPIAFSTRGPDDPYVYVPSGIRLLRRASVDVDDTTLPSPHHLPAHPSSPIKIYLPTAPPELHTTLQLTHLWLSSVFMADLISHGIINVTDDDDDDERICELGAGAGLPGIVCAVRGAREVVSTDYAVPEQGPRERDEQDRGGTVLDVLRSNFLRAVPDAQAREGKSWAVLGHTWGDEPSVSRILSSLSASHTNSHSPRRQTFSLLLLADLLWSTASHGALIHSLTKLLDPETGRACVVAGLHQGRGPVERFLRSWRDGAGGWVRYEMEVQWGHEQGWEVLEDFRSGRGHGRKGEGEEAWKRLYDEDRQGGDEHGTVVYFTIGLGNPR
ncbi:hypothetical protein QFC24_000077 [Naganishia onofrii]|uniref:Uncharacterized protein n=1 Tax=Naganishia onofrii TaxID=1851511 RepID=A0ACC2XUT5_9TREE|nr:hypothetical protein QFC24_000077 [Naganishia onofrii]